MYKKGPELPHFCDSQLLDDAVELGHQHRDLVTRCPHMNVFGGCCGTDYVHVRRVCEAVRQQYG